MEKKSTSRANISAGRLLALHHAADVGHDFHAVTVLGDGRFLGRLQRSGAPRATFALCLTGCVQRLGVWLDGQDAGGAIQDNLNLVGKFQQIGSRANDGR